MAPFIPIFLSRSDGRLETTSLKSKKKEPNAPSAAQLNPNREVNGNRDYYKSIEVGDTKEVDWRRKLGGMLMKEIGDKDFSGERYQTLKSNIKTLTYSAQKSILGALPENYRLYEHVKVTTHEVTGELFHISQEDETFSDKRQDTYLYGHPEGPKKRYRSPADFFPHVLWLATDESGDPNNCSCKMCVPEDIQAFDRIGKSRAEIIKKEDLPMKKDRNVSKPGAGTFPMVVIPSGPASVEKPSKPVPKPQPSSNPNHRVHTPTQASILTPPAAPSQPMPTFVDSATCFEQQQDSEYNRYLFRPGELVWFNKGSSWGLAIVTKRDLFKDQRIQDRPKYLLQPLSHPFHNPGLRIISQEDLLRPWLAWSIPNPTYAALHAAPGLTFNSIDWKSVLQGHYGEGDPEVDGSIFASKAVDESFTLIEAVSNNTIETGERFYNGIFFGAEKIWVGEPVRLRVGSGQDIMIVHRILEKLKPGSTNTASATIHFVGDIYSFSTNTYTPGLQPPDNRHLPTRLRQDLEYRNRATLTTKRMVSAWNITQAQARVGLSDVKGRWYESSVLLPILRGAAAFTADLGRGEISDVGQWMNGRADSTLPVGKQGTRYLDRLDVFGKSIPPGTKISKGLDGPPEDNVFPLEQSLEQSLSPSLMEEDQPTGRDGQGQGQGQGQHANQHQHQQVISDGDMADFINMKGIDDEEFVNNYGDGGSQYFSATGSGVGGGGGGGMQR